MNSPQDKNIKPFSRANRLQSFRYAWQGLGIFLRDEPHAAVHLFFTVLAMVMAVVSGVSKTEALALLLVTGFVWTAELCNTAIEKIMDFISTEKHPSIGVIKDISAAAVMVAAFTALVTGCVVFIPKC